MKPFAVIPLLLLFMISGCQSFSIGGETAHAGESGLRVIFFYDQTSISMVKNDYFDALLEVVNSDSLKRQQITIHSEYDGDLAEDYGLSQSPGLVIMNNGEAKVRIEGNKDRDFIVQRLEQTLNLTKAND
ncbi:MAG TPA: hypothetical protein VFT51_00965 [Bacillales bacterium]|nr:hypothetical protein [Bacillales bacterium]